MPLERWDESGRVWEEDHGLLDAEQVARCERADVAEALRGPVPTRMVSNGEYMPAPQTDAQKHVEARIEELAETGDGVGPGRVTGRADKALRHDRFPFITGRRTAPPGCCI